MKFKVATMILATLFLLGSSINNKSNTESISPQTQRFTDNKDGTISDSKTGLMWMKNDSYLHSGHWHNWYEAKAYIKNLNETGFANYFDWQYPTIRQLKTLFDADKLNSAQVGR